MRILLWHVHGSWTNAFVRGGHEYLMPVLPDRGPDGLGLSRPWSWPASATERPPEDLAGADVDLVVLQRPHEIDLVRRWLYREPGADVPAVYVEHNVPRGSVPDTRHPVATLPGVELVHVTHFNQLMWDAGSAPTRVVEHGVVDPGSRYTGELPRIAVVANEPIRRWRVTGTDLLPAFAEVAPVDVFGMRVTGLESVFTSTRNEIIGYEDLPQRDMHRELARRRVYVHTCRWTSLGLSLLEAMHLAMPVVAPATTEAVAAVPAEAGTISTSAPALVAAAARFVADPELARRTGERARAAALHHYGLERFLADWDVALADVAAGRRASSAAIV